MRHNLIHRAVVKFKDVVNHLPLGQLDCSLFVARINQQPDFLLRKVLRLRIRIKAADAHNQTRQLDDRPRNHIKNRSQYPERGKRKISKFLRTIGY